MSLARPCIDHCTEEGAAGWCPVDCSSGEPVLGPYQASDPGVAAARCSLEGTATHACVVECEAGEPRVVVVPEPPAFDQLLAGALALAALSMWC